MQQMIPRVPDRDKGRDNTQSRVTQVAQTIANAIMPLFSNNLPAFQDWQHDGHIDQLGQIITPGEVEEDRAEGNMEVEGDDRSLLNQYCTYVIFIVVF